MPIKNRPTSIYTGTTMPLVHGARMEIVSPLPQANKITTVGSILVPKYMESCHVTVIFLVPIMRT